MISKPKYDYVIIADNTTDLPKKYVEENHIHILNYSFSIAGKDYYDPEEMSFPEFYKLMREGNVPKTTQIPMNVFNTVFRDYASQGKDVIFFSFSSALSGNYNTAKMIANEVSEEYPDRKILVVDTKCCSLGEGLLVMNAVDRANEGLSIDELYNWAEENKLRMIHLFTVDDLIYLHRGGRISKTAAVAGSILGIKPVLHVDEEGRLVPVKKVRGRKQSLNELVTMMGEQMGNEKNPYINISHGDALEDAEYVAAEIKKRYGIKKANINFVDSTIGAHSGPGTIALFFLGNKR